jgi:hypothetical protein
MNTYRKHNKPALGPLDDSLDDFARNSSLCITH